MSDVSSSHPAYCGRFAPSPTGLLHAGSLMTAVGSYLEAITRQGRWLLRIEDLDTPRMIPGAADAILSTLERLGFEWHGPVLYQSQRHAYYRQALDALIRQDAVYPCSCSRKDIQATGTPGVDGMIYPRFCRSGPDLSRSHRAWRFKVDAREIGFVDRLQGRYSQQLARDIGDFVLLRADGIWAYQLAVVVDDALQGVNDVVRGVDLLVSTPRQMVLQQALAWPTPTYCHLPLLINAAGEKLSKQTLAPAITSDRAVDELRRALTRLGHCPPADLLTLAELWQWARQNWQPARVPLSAVRNTPV